MPVTKASISPISAKATKSTIVSEAMSTTKATVSKPTAAVTEASPMWIRIGDGLGSRIWKWFGHGLHHYQHSQGHRHYKQGGQLRKEMSWMRGKENFSVGKSVWEQEGCTHRSHGAEWEMLEMSRVEEQRLACLQASSTFYSRAPRLESLATDILKVHRPYNNFQASFCGGFPHALKPDQQVVSQWILNRNLANVHSSIIPTQRHACERLSSFRWHWLLFALGKNGNFMRTLACRGSVFSGATGREGRRRHCT